MVDLSQIFSRLRYPLGQKASHAFDSAREFSRIRVQYLRRTLRNKASHLSARALMRLLRIHYLITGKGLRYVRGASYLTATIICLIIAILYFSVAKKEAVPDAQVYLTCAQILGAALALILSLSIIPAQRAAEAFSAAILTLYARDWSLIATFATLVTTTSISVFLGTASFAVTNPKISLLIQFLIFGISFDALRLFYARMLELLSLQTAVRLVVSECSHHVAKVSKLIRRTLAIQRMSDGSTPNDVVPTEALLFSVSSIPNSLNPWIKQLGEVAHKLIAQRDTTGTNFISSALIRIGTDYVDQRRTSLLLIPDLEQPFAGGQSDVNAVLNPLYDSLRTICEDAAKAGNEAVVRHCIQVFGEMTIYAMGILHNANGWNETPFAFSPCYHAGECTKTAMRANMQDAILQSIHSFQVILLRSNENTDTTTETQALEALELIALASYSKEDWVTVFPAVQAMLLFTQHEIQQEGHSDSASFETVLRNLVRLVPFEVAMEITGRRRQQTFPPYNLGFRAAVPYLLQDVTNQIEPTEAEDWRDPFSDFLEAAEDIRAHYRELSRIDFQNTLLRKWAVDSLIASARVHYQLLAQPPEGAERHLDGVSDSLRALLSWVSGFFENQTPFPRHQAEEAARSLTCFAIELLRINCDDAAKECGAVIERICSYSASPTPDPYVLANLQNNLEILARASVALAKTGLVADFRTMITRPAGISEENWPHYEAIREDRISDLDRSLADRRHPRTLTRINPVDMLIQILSGDATANQE